MDMAQNYEFRLSTKEVDYLRQLASRDESFARLLRFEEALPDRKVIIRLNRAEAGQLRECLGTDLAAVGFDKDYEPNEQGQMLEDLIDRFFIR